jgi:hypothetical protein
MKMLKIAMDFTSLHPVSKLNSQGRVKFSLFRYGSQRGLAKPLKKSSKSWLMLWSMDMVEAASP